MRSILLTVATLSLSLTVSARPTLSPEKPVINNICRKLTPPDDESAIRSILAAQTEAWNQGLLEKFMQGYWKNDSLMFIGKTGVTYGWNNTLENYRKGYPDTTAMGQLHFDIIRVRVLTKEYAEVVGKWTLVRTIGNLTGHFSLLWRKINGKWVIISDHSS